MGKPNRNNLDISVGIRGFFRKKV